MFSIQYYQMQTLLMPKGILNELERISRDFLWNQQPDTSLRKLHLIGWDTCKKDKEFSGLGIKDLRSPN